MKKEKTPRQLLKDCVIKLLIDDPFWAVLLMRLRVVMTDTLVPTAGVDGVSVVVNNGYFKDLSFEKRLGLLVHEACHIAFKHMLRRGDKDFFLWNLACDYAIDQLIVRKMDHTNSYSGYLLPTWDGPTTENGGHIDPQYTGMSAEEIYRDLIKKNPKNQMRCKVIIDKDGKAVSRPDGGDVVFDAPSTVDPEEKRAFEEMVDLAIAAALKEANGKGTVPGQLRSEIEARHQHVINYQELLRDWLSKEIFSHDYNWMVADRRFTDTGFHIPSLDENLEGLPNILFIADVSGSMLNDHDLPKIASEIQGVLNEFPAKYWVLYTDADFDPENIQEVSFEKPLKLEFKGGGGTDFKAVMDFLKKDDKYQYEAILFFTDMATCSYGEDPGKPVLWMNTCNYGYSQPPYGRVIEVK